MMKRIGCLIFFLFFSISGWAKDPIAWHSNGDIPKKTTVSVTSYVMSYTLTNQFPFKLTHPIKIGINSNSPTEFNVNNACSGQLLAPNASCNVTITFTPVTVGVKTIQLSLQYDSNVVPLPLITTTATTAFSIGGSVAGLTSSGLVLQNNGRENVSVASGASSFLITSAVAYGGNYNVTVKTQPAGQLCSVINGSGQNVTENVTNVIVTCTSIEYTIGGAISNLTASGLVLQNNSGDNTTVSLGSTTFTFGTPLLYGAHYDVTILTQPTGLICTVNHGTGTVTSNVTNIRVTCNVTTFTISGTISGLTASGLILQNNDHDNLAKVSGSTTFTFTKPVAFGSDYNVTVLSQPTGLTCTVNNGSGTNVQANVTNVIVTCSTSTFTIGGAVSGLSASGLVIQNNGLDSFNVTSGVSSYTFPSPVAFGANYTVTILTQPAGLTCSISNATGTVNADVTNVNIACVINYYSIGGSISGLTSTGLVLQNNGADNLSISSGATNFTFPTQIASGSAYHVTIQTQPSGQSCVVNNGTGTVTGNVTTVGIVCSSTTYTISGTIRGLTAIGLVLQNNDANNLSVASGATAFTFTQPVPFGGFYHVTVYTQPTGLTCTVSNASGHNVQANVTNVSVVCSRDAYTIGGSISNLTGGGLILQNNGSDDLPVAANSTSFQFSTSVAYGGGYDVTIKTQPTGQQCIVSNGSGVNVINNITSVSITCAENQWAYITNGIDSVLFCSIANAGTLTSCNPTGSGFNGPSGMTIHPTHSWLYVTNSNINFVSLCTIVPNTGELTSCAQTSTDPTGAVFAYGAPVGIAINPAGNIAYIADAQLSLVICDIDQSNGALTGCVASSDSSVTVIQPNGIVMNSTGTFVYLSGSVQFTGTSGVYVCNIASMGQLTNCAIAMPVDSQGIAINPTNPYFYITGEVDYVQYYSIQTNTGALSLEASYNNSNFDQAQGIAISSMGQYAYIVVGPSVVSICTIDLNTGALTVPCPNNSVAGGSQSLRFIVLN